MPPVPQFPGTPSTHPIGRVTTPNHPHGLIVAAVTRSPAHWLACLVIGLMVSPFVVVGGVLWGLAKLGELTWAFAQDAVNGPQE